MEQQVLGLLHATLHTTSNQEREQAYKTIENLQRQSGYCESLCTISVETQIDFDTRHLATVLLRSMIEKNWGLSNQPIQQARLRKEKTLRREFQEEDDDGRVIPGCSTRDHEQIMIQEDEKKRLRGRLIEGLHLPEMKMKAQFALMLGVLVKYDFPHQMTEFLPYLIQQIQEHSTGEAGAVLCLEIIIHPDFLFDDDQMENVTKQIMPFVTSVYQNSSKFGEATRKSMIMILFSVINWIVNRRVEREDQQEGMMPILQELLPGWMPQIIKDLEMSSHTPLRICILQVLCLLVYAMPQTLLHRKYIQALLPQAWKVFVGIQQIYQNGEILSSALQQASTDDIDFNCGTVYLFQNFVLLLLEFFHAILDSKILGKFMFFSVVESVYVLVHYMQYSYRQLETYEFEEDQYTIAEQEGKYCISSLSVRSSAGKLLSELLARKSIVPDVSVIEQALQAISMRLQESSKQLAQNSDSWRLREATLFACTKSLRYFFKHNKDFCNSFPDFVKTLQGDLQSSVSPFLATRALLCVAKSFKSLPSSLVLSEELLQPFHQFIGKYILALELTPQWIGSVLSIQWILRYTSQERVPEHIGKLLEAMARIATEELQAESLLLCLDSMITIIQRIPTHRLNGEIVTSLIACALKLWQNHSQDSYISSYVLDILQAIVSHPTEEILGVACREGVPLIQQVLKSPELESEKSTAIDLFEIFISASSKYPRAVNEQGSILANLLQACFPALMDLLLQLPIHADLIIASGTKCLFTIYYRGLEVREGFDAPAISEDQAQQLLPLTLQFTSKLLADDASDIVCMDVGPLLSILLIRCPNAFVSSAETFKSLLQTIVLRVQRAQMFDVQQGLFAVIARLLCMNPEVTINNLQATGRFENILQFWIREYPQFCEQYIGKLSVLSFGHLLLTPCSQELLGKITIRVQVECATARVTRSAAKQGNSVDQWKEVLAPGHLMEVLLGEFLTSCENEEDGEDFEDFEDFGSDTDGSFDEENEWDPLGDVGDGFYGVDELLDGDDELEDGLSSILVKCDPLTLPDTNNILRDILTATQQHEQLFTNGMNCFSPVDQQNLAARLINKQ